MAVYSCQSMDYFVNNYSAIKFDLGMHGIAPGVGNYSYDFMHAWMSELLQL